MIGLFSTKERLKILKNVIFEDSAISVNKIARNTRLSKGLVSKYLNLLTKSNITYKSGNKYYIGKTPLLKGIKILISIQSIDIKIFRKYKFIESVGLYGSLAKGENTSESDVDMWLKIENISDDKLASLSAELRRKVKNVRPLFLTASRIKQIKNDDMLFWHSLVFGSILLYGAEDGIQI